MRELKSVGSQAANSSEDIECRIEDIGEAKDEPARKTDCEIDIKVNDSEDKTLVNSDNRNIPPVK